jgi:hypothetical protein
MPPVFAHALKGAPGETFYLAFAGPATWLETGRKFTFADIRDGTSNTFFLVESGQALPWTKPDDLPFEPGKALPQLGRLSADGFHAAMFDGSVRFVQGATPAAALRALITRNGEEAIALLDEPSPGSDREPAPRPNPTPVTDPKVAQTTPAAGDNRKKWAYEAGVFEHVGGTSWLEKDNAGNITFRFEEKGRTSEFVELYDASRNGFVRLLSTKAMWQRGPDRFDLYPGSWQSEASAPANAPLR